VGAPEGEERLVEVVPGGGEVDDGRWASGARWLDGGEQAKDERPDPEETEIAHCPPLPNDTRRRSLVGASLLDKRANSSTGYEGGVTTEWEARPLERQGHRPTRRFAGERDQ